MLRKHIDLRNNINGDDNNNNSNMICALFSLWTLTAQITWVNALFACDVKWDLWRHLLNGGGLHRNIWRLMGTLSRSINAMSIWYTQRQKKRSQLYVDNTYLYIDSWTHEQSTSALKTYEAIFIKNGRHGTAIKLSIQFLLCS